MEIAFIASDSKKELIAEFCIAYCGVLSRHKLYATATTARYIHEATGLEVESLLAGVHGGDQQLASRISYNEIDILLFFRDTASDKDYSDDQFDIIRMCDSQNVPVATNIATAEALIMALDRGDLDWRMYVNPRLQKSGQNG